IEYLRKVPRHASHRQLFLRLTAPIGALKPSAVSEAFHLWATRSGLDIPFYGAHCIRHSYAVHLLRQGTSLKAIGYLLRHRCSESTTGYLRLATEELREVGLSVPQLRSKKGGAHEDCILLRLSAGNRALFGNQASVGTPLR